MLLIRMYACTYAQGHVPLGLFLGRHPKINLFCLHYYTTVLFVVKWRQNKVVFELVSHSASPSAICIFYGHLTL